MADDQNKSNKPMNGFGMSDIEKIGQSAYSVSKAEQDQRQRAETAQSQIDALSQLPNNMILGSKALTRLAQTAPNTLLNAQQRIATSVSARMDRSNAQAVNSIGRAYSQSSINSGVRDMYESSVYQNQALTMGGLSYEELAEKREAINGQIQNLGASSAYAAKGLFGEHGKRGNNARTIAANAAQAEQLTGQIASIDLAMKSRRAIGADPKSRYENLTQMGKSADDLLSARQIGAEVASGTVNISRGGQQVGIASGDIGTALGQEAENLKKALADLANAAGKSSEELAAMRKSAEETADNFEKLQRAQQMGGGGGGASGAQWLSAAGGMFGAIGAGIQQIGVNQRLGQVSNIGGYANIENQKYDMYKAGRGGSVLDQMMASQWASAERFGGQLKTAQGAALTATAAGGIAQAGAGAFQIGEGATGKVVGITGQVLGTGSLSTKQVLEGAQNVVQGAATTAVAGMDLYRGVSTGQVAQQGINADMTARKELLRVSAEQLQGFRDFGVGMSTAAMSMGKRGGAMLDSATSAAGIQQMVNSRLSPEQMAQLSQQGVLSMGSQFSTGSVFAARNLERSGMGSMQENMQRMASLSMAGGNNPQAGLASVLESAFSKSLDSSKAISAMVENTASMAMKSAGAAVGLDVTAAQAGLTAAGISGKNPNQEFAVQRAAQAAELSNQYGTNTDVSFSGMVNTARLSKQLGISGEESISLQRVDAATLKTLQGKSEQEQREFLLNRGIDVKGRSATNIVSGALDYKANSILEAGGAGLAQGIDSDALRKKIQSGGKLSDAERLQLGRTAQFGGYTGAEELISQVKGLSDTPNAAAKSAAAKAMAGEAGTDSQKTWDNLRTSGFKQLSEQALQATKTMEKFGGALKVLVDMNDKLEKFGSSGGEAKFSTAAADAAESFGKHTVKFGEAVGAFDDAVTKMMSRSGLNTSGMDGQREVDKLMKAADKAKNTKQTR